MAGVGKLGVMEGGSLFLSNRLPHACIKDMNSATSPVTRRIVLRLEASKG